MSTVKKRGWGSQMQEVEGEIETNWKRLRTTLLHSRFPTFSEFEKENTGYGARIFVWTASDPFFDFDHLEEFCSDGLAQSPRMFARLRYRRFEYRTEVALVGLSFEIEDDVEETHFCIANWIGEAPRPQVAMSLSA